MSRADDLRDRMGSTANREQPEQAPPARTPKVAPYKGTFEVDRATAKRLRVTSAEYDVSITRLVEAAVMTMLDDPATLDTVIERAEQLATPRKLTP